MTYPYDLKDWMVDWRNVLEASESVPLENKTQHLRRVFLARYPDEEEAFWRCNRVLAALRYMEANVTPFEEAGYLLASSKGGMVGRELSIMLCGVFGQVDDSEVLNPPRPEVFIYVMKEARRLTGD